MQKDLILNFIEEVKRLCKELQLEPFELTKTLFFSQTKTEITPSQLERLGGYTSIIKTHFGEAPDKELGYIYGSSQQKSYVKKLERQVGKQTHLYENIVEKVCHTLKDFNFPVKKEIKKPAIKRQKREIVAVVSDTHFGLEIDKDELGGVNEYNWIIAARRMGLFAEQIATFKLEYRSETPNLRLCLNGDLAQGLIHLSDANTDLITHQIIGTVNILYQMIAYLRRYFKHIYVECTPDNHLRMVHKGPDRAKAQKFDSYATIIHYALAMGFKNTQDVTFNIPITPYTVFNVLGNNFYSTHGDTMINVGRPGKKINTDLITNAANKLNAALKDKDEYKVIIVGHVHTPCFITLDNGTELVVNGTGSGLDPYANSIGIFESNPVQVLFESMQSFPVGDQRKIFLKYADDDANYEKIVKPYNYLLTP